MNENQLHTEREKRKFLTIYILLMHIFMLTLKSDVRQTEILATAKDKKKKNSSKLHL